MGAGRRSGSGADEEGAVKMGGQGVVGHPWGTTPNPVGLPQGLDFQR